MLLLLALSTKSVLEGACIHECLCECVWERVWGFVGLWKKKKNTPLRSHKGTLSLTGQRHLSRTKETKYDVGVGSLLELWYRKSSTDIKRRHQSSAFPSIPIRFNHFKAQKKEGRVDISGACTFIYLLHAATTSPAAYSFSIFGSCAPPLPLSLTNAMCFPHTDFTWAGRSGVLTPAF